MNSTFFTFATVIDEKLNLIIFCATLLGLISVSLKNVFSELSFLILTTLLREKEDWKT